MIDLCNHTNLTGAYNCLMNYNSPYKPFIYIIGLIILIVIFWIFGEAIKDSQDN